MGNKPRYREPPARSPMPLKWTNHALGDLARLYEFLAPANSIAAAHAVQSLVGVAAKIQENPRIGIKLGEFEPREVRRIFIANYEVRYEIRESIIYILRIWHTRENR